jgi:hypothetical protein
MDWTRKDLHTILKPAGWAYNVMNDSAGYRYNEAGHPLRMIWVTLPALQVILRGKPRETDVAALVRRYVDSVAGYWLVAHIKLDEVTEGHIRIYWRTTMLGKGVEDAVSVQNRIVKIEEIGGSL